ncbi:hypothetical protein GA0061091_1212 [Gordonia sp. v-85]|nr:hypothetical protein GA0061091_1212 [Gordonia sp. v-85]
MIIKNEDQISESAVATRYFCLPDYPRSGQSVGRMTKIRHHNALVLGERRRQVIDSAHLPSQFGQRVGSNEHSVRRGRQGTCGARRDRVIRARGQIGRGLISQRFRISSLESASGASRGPPQRSVQLSQRDEPRFSHQTLLEASHSRVTRPAGEAYVGLRQSQFLPAPLHEAPKAQSIGHTRTLSAVDPFRGSPLPKCH